MNERIKELIREAESTTNEGIGFEGQEYTDMLMERFAELIIKECARVQHKRFCEHGDVSWDILMEHFGVDE
jgi:hypothetical protein